MSKIGKQLTIIPENIKVEMKGNQISVEGPKGKLERTFPSEIFVEEKDREISVKFKGPKDKKALWGTWSSIIKNMVEGAFQGFEKKLKIEGVGWRASIEGKELVLKVGFSHLVKIMPPEGITFFAEKDTIKISGADKEKVGASAAKIRAVCPPEPYKGKGIRYDGEVIRRKAGKKAITAEK